jgi:hypothetical protein
MRFLLVPILLASCSGGDSTVSDAGSDVEPITRCSGFVGDPALPVQVEAIVTVPDGYVVTENGEQVLLKPVAGIDGMRVPLIQAPQGGKHIFAGVRVKNIDTCPVSLVGSIRDTSGRVQYEGRPVDMLVGDDGWAYPAQPKQIGSYANIGLCANHWSSRDIYEQPYELELKVSDKEGRTAKTTLSIVPFCGAEPKYEAECRCICALDAVCPAG